MKKAVGITAGVVIVLAAGWLGATWYTGKRIEAEAPARLEEVNQKLADALSGMGFGVTIKQIGYERHFFTSQARYGVSLVKGPDGPEDLPQGTAEFVSRIQHGPFPKDALARGHLMPALAFVHAELAANDDLKPLFELTKGATPLWSDTIVSYNGDSTGTAGLAPIEFSKDGDVLKFSGAHAEGRYIRSTQNSIGRVTIDQVALDASKSDQPVKLNLAGLVFDVDTRMGQFGLGVGSSSAQVERIDIQDLDTETQVALQGLGYTAVLAESGSNLNLEAGYRIGQIQVNGKDFGKGQANLKLERLDGKAVNDLSKLYNQIVQEVGEGSTADAALTDERRQALLQLGRQLLAGNPSMRLDPVLWQTAKGESRLSVAIDLAKPAALDAAPPAADNLQAIVQQAIKGIDVKVALSKPMAQDLIAQYMQGQGLDAQQASAEADDQVRSLAGMAEMLNLGKNDGDKLVASFQYADGKANLNGNEIPADELFGNLLGGLGGDGEDEMSAADGGMLSSLDPALVGDILDEAGFAYEIGATAQGYPLIEIEPGDSGAAGLRVEFNDCDIESACSDLLLRASFASKQPVPLKLLNDWNVRNRWTRAYLDTDNQAVLEMDVNAYGGIGDNGADFLVKTFLASVPQFAETLASAPR
ncbi:DUF945 family protein [Bordetella petrii]|uniref:DUF945 family protein n=1 Tax=Bordetella petrii TaxID=94624 RepID=UPI001A95E177|nr:DUF945 family protein [Bordetella petrii]MBO1113939.1 DUF945 family protein [Bordetella petrii]